MHREDVTLVGGFPPPINGAAKNNQLLYEELVATGRPVRRLDIAGPTISHKRSGTYHLARLRRVLIALVSIATRGGRLIYLVPDGGHGVWYSLAILTLARMRFRHQVIHHRTFRYIDRRTLAMAAITATTRSTATHVFLTEGMKRRFEHTYGTTRSLICTNAVYVSDVITRNPTNDVPPRLRLGHLSNLCQAKGFYDVVNTFEGLLAQGVDCELHLAGPAVEKNVVTSIEALLRRHGDRVSYIGSVSGATKSAFYDGIDVFLFPTDYPEEAAPNVIYEAFANGIPVLTKKRGCIPELFADENFGIAFDTRDQFVPLAISTLSAMALDSSSKGARGRHIREHLTREIAVSTAQHQRLMALITDVEPES